MPGPAGALGLIEIGFAPSRSLRRPLMTRDKRQGKGLQDPKQPLRQQLPDRAHQGQGVVTDSHRTAEHRQHRGDRAMGQRIGRRSPKTVVSE